ncbi:autotransporter outer membrane beta-barrel domain-containing protein [Roseibium sp. RKSG952]|uniref:autotransporter outer membrane beta-barrel domain-containing protein n=1 Tax=Roseibium sp. RKSG952 TaxID=2529384 RepID=UPI0012BBF42B|nr:autotransporter outer membrane beta-barrel domain-containing protein [Roseibium sp. RKSG952]MTH98755.1 autotransporter outer membrane beta-barrel domain-containing protein [Roseibium sp. RKSG952]
MALNRTAPRPASKTSLALGLVFACGLSPQILSAQNAPCASLGSLRSLTTTEDGSQSLWLSRTTGGSRFALDATASSTRVDTWVGQGLHISASPVVATGVAGAHTLSEISGDGGDCEIATTNQLARPDQTLPPVPIRPGGGGTEPDGGGATGGQQLTESAIIGFSPILLGRWSITERLNRRALGPYGADSAGSASTKEESLAWFDVTYLHANNNQFGRGGRDNSAQIIVGADLWQSGAVKVGFAGGFESTDTDSFNNTVSADANSYFIGPYLGWRPDEYTLVDIWLGYANRKFKNGIAAYRSSFDADRFFVDANITRRINSGNYSIFPKLGIFYANDDMPTHQYSNGTSTFTVTSHNAETLITRLAVDIWRDPIIGSNGLQWLPFMSAGVDWYAEQPGDRRVLSNDMTIDSTGDVIGSLSAGTDILTENGGRWTTKVTYDGIGLSGYNEVEVELAFNFDF